MEIQPKITEIEDISPFHTKITMEPFERGYGHTLGNALRRTMLSSIPGFAPTEVKIENVVHEYDTIEGVREDVVMLLLNLKGVAFKLRDSSNAVIKLEKTGPCRVTAADLKLPHNAQVVNPDHEIATLEEGGKLSMEITVTSGTGYQPSSSQPESRKQFGHILLDASFSPVRQVSFDVESARVEHEDRSRSFGSKCIDKWRV